MGARGSAQVAIVICCREKQLDSAASATAQMACREIGPAVASPAAASLLQALRVQPRRRLSGFGPPLVPIRLPGVFRDGNFAEHCRRSCKNERQPI